MSKRSRSCSDLRGVSIIKSNRHKIPKRDSSNQMSLIEPEYNTYVQDSPNERFSLDDFDTDDIDVPSYDIDRQIKKNETLSKLIHSLIEKQSREKRQSCLENSRRTSKFSSDTGANTKKPSTDQSSISSSHKRKSRPSDVTKCDIEYMREIIRMDKGLPTTKVLKKKSIDLHKLPKIIPRPNRLSQSRYECTRTSYPELRSLYSRDDFSCHEKLTDDYDRSPQEMWDDEDLRRLKYLADSHENCDPSYNFNRVFHLRYQHDRGYPEIPDSFRQSYIRYNKPLFHLVKDLNLPKKYLLPTFKENEISVLGLTNKVPLRIVNGRKNDDKEECIKKRKPIAKRGRVMKMKNDNLTSVRVPWKYGGVKSSSPSSIL